MTIIKGTTDFSITEPTVVTIGKYDGLHIGHKSILDRMSTYRSRGYRVAVLTFDVSPSLMGFGNDTDVLMTMNEKEQVFMRYGIDYLVEFPFYEKTASISAQQFIEEYIVDKMNAKAIVVGSDCTFGYQAKGNASMLCDYGPIYGYEVEVIEKLKDGDREISSTYIRELVRDGNVLKADELSFRPFFVNGKFNRGPSQYRAGRVLYYMELPEGKVLPAGGVYYSKVLLDDAFYPALTRVVPGKRRFATYVYGDVKGITRGIISVALFEKMHDLYDLATIKEEDQQATLDIFEGEKWHKMHPRN